MNKKVLGIIVVIIVALVGGSAFMKLSGSKSESGVNGETIKITHRYGETEVPVNPKKVVILDLGTLDIMTVLGADVIALPKSNLPSYLDKYSDEKYTDIGTLKEFNIEKINELQPDLIIIEGRQESFYDELSKIAPTIGLGTVNDDFIGSLKNNTEVIGKIFNKEKEATKELEKIEKDLAEIKDKVEASGKNALMTMVSDGSISVYGKSSRFSIMYNEIGFKVADDNITDGSHGQTISYEYLLEKNPDYLFVLDKGVILKGEQQPAKDIIENDITKKMNAYNNNKIIYLDTETWYLGGSGLMATESMINEINEAIK
ncbi:MAG: siderophore ABC transporter substrate-binding protein [Clostridium sp.]